MEKIIYTILIIIISFCMNACNGEREYAEQVFYPNYQPEQDPDEISNQMSNDIMPVVGVWSSWRFEDYKEVIDQASNHSPFNILIPFLRFPDKEVVDDEIINQVRIAAEYAIENNILLAPDLDIRSARRAFQSQYPDELQQMLRIKEVELSEKDKVEVYVTSIKDLMDHFSGGDIPKYNSIESSVLRVYSYAVTPYGIDSETIVDITTESEVLFSVADSVVIQIPPTGNEELTHASVMVSFTLSYPDVFAPHLLQFKDELIQMYADIPLAGLSLDEWGFPPYYPRFYEKDTIDYWYSEHRAFDYAKRTGGRELLADFLLMAFEINGRESERVMAINHFNEMALHRMIETEEAYYNSVKDAFGPDAFVGVHSTWWPYPDYNEFKKNGLSWWGAKRDFAQTDELVPFGIRTAMSKKWEGSPLWYHMYYSYNLPSQVWAAAAAGGRINYLSIFDFYKGGRYEDDSYDAELMRGENRIRLLNYIIDSPVDCRIAVVFGHAAAMNWAGPYHDDVGMSLVDTLWYSGYWTDLIPTSEIENGSLYVDEAGWISYGEQRYDVVVLYQPEYEKETTSDFFQRAGDGPSTLFRIGDWTKDFNGSQVNSNSLLPQDMIVSDNHKDGFMQVLDVLDERDIFMQTPATGVLDSTYWFVRDWGGHTTHYPSTTSSSRLIDGTVIHVAGTHNRSGDPIQKTFMINDYEVFVDAIGVAAVRLDTNGQLEALAAGGLKSFRTGDFSIDLNNRSDIALWVDDEGEWSGVIQGEDGIISVPEELVRITDNWIRLNAPSLNQ